MSEAVPVRALQTRAEQRQERIVEVLEEALDRARAGEFEAVLIAFDLAGPDATEYLSSGYDVAHVVGTLERLKFRVLHLNQHGDE